jgi:L,D-peptidoglycan transpeptidase YkuD (ErfK/YbiS/YcfS/YnhG family)
VAATTGIGVAAVGSFGSLSASGTTSATAASIVIDRGGHGSRSAARDVPWRPGATCDLATVAALTSRHPDVRQFIVLTTTTFADTIGSAFAAVRRLDGSWACQTDAVVARFGRAGTRPLADRRSGDGTTPAGVFPLGVTTAWDGQRFSVFGNSPNPGVRNSLGYRNVQAEDCWGATPNTASYNHLVNAPGCAGPDDEWLTRFGDVYAHAAVIGANLDPISGDQPGETPFASAIFLHRNSYATPGASSGTTKPTSGCVSLAYPDLVDIVRLLDPTLATRFAIGPADWLRSTA